MTICSLRRQQNLQTSTVFHGNKPLSEKMSTHHQWGFVAYYVPQWVSMCWEVCYMPQEALVCQMQIICLKGLSVLKINGTLPVWALTSSSSVSFTNCDLVRQCGETEICVISNSDSGLLPWHQVIVWIDVNSPSVRFLLYVMCLIGSQCVEMCVICLVRPQCVKCIL